MRSATVVESSDLDIDLEPQQAEALALIGKRLASTKGWWGEDANDGADVLEKSVIAVRPQGGGRYTVRIADAVGVIAVKDLQIVVEPKIPVSHLLYLFGRSGHVPRPDEQVASVGMSSDLWELVATWFVAQAERTLRTGLVLDYHDVAEDLRFMRGQLGELDTAGAFYGGRIEFACRFDEFGLDTSLNRILLAASRGVVGSERLAPALRRRGRRIVARLDGVGGLREGDLRAVVDRRTAHYRDAITLARNILLSQGRTLAAGGAVAWTFLIRTPEMVEAGVRAVLEEALGKDRVVKKGVHAVGTKLSFNPDLVFEDGSAVGDVKYKVSSGDWKRPDLYQSIAFAEAFECDESLIVRFRTDDTPALDPVIVGRKRVTEVTWLAEQPIPPSLAADRLAAGVRRWLNDITVSQRGIA